MPIVVPFRSAIELYWVFFPVITALERVRATQNSAEIWRYLPVERRRDVAPDEFVRFRAFRNPRNKGVRESTAATQDLLGLRSVRRDDAGACYAHRHIDLVLLEASDQLARSASKASMRDGFPMIC